MNKKLLFAAVSLAALTACSTDDFESQNIAAEKTSPVQFEVINNNDSFTRAYMDGSNIHWEASKGDLFTLYHGGEVTGDKTLTSCQNATYTAVEGDGAATLTTPSMILAGNAIMIWPVDTTFTNKGEAVAISIPETLDNIENNITYASDLVDIKAYKDETPEPTYGIGADNTAGYSRKYPVYMRPLTSQLTLKADYAGTEEAIKALYEGADPIDPIKVTSVDLTSEAKNFTQKIALNFTAAEETDITRWGGATRDNNWSHITGFATTVAAGDKVKTLTTKVLTGNESAKFLILPKSVADDHSAVVVNTIYGKVTTASYTEQEMAKAWYKMSGTTKEGETTVQAGMTEVFTKIDAATVKANTVVKGEPVGASATRYVKVLLKYIDMDGLHVTSDKQLYDAVRVWKELGLDNKDPEKHTITVYLDGDKGEFKISQKTIAKINELNAAAAKEETSRSFQVMPCKKAGEACNTIVITDGGTIAQDLSFIVENPEGGEDKKAAVALNAGKEWKWNSKNVTVDATATGISKIINRGTLVSDATATLKIMNNAATPAQVNIAFENALGATWNITAGELTVQFDVTNLGTVNISQGAEYHQDIIKNGEDEAATTFTNQALTVPERFFTAKEKKNNKKEQIGVVNNSGVFCVTGTSNAGGHKGVINNYGRIEHKLATAKTFITSNQQGTGVTFATPFSATSGSEKKLGLINLPWAIRSSATNVSVSSALNQGFISLTYTGATNTEELKGDIGGKVNYVIVESGIATVGELSDNIKYLEINEPGTEIHFTKSTKDADPTADPAVLAKNKFAGLMVLSPVNIEQGVNLVISEATFLAAKMYVGGTFTQDKWNGYYGNTTDNFTSMYRTY